MNQVVKSPVQSVSDLVLNISARYRLANSPGYSFLKNADGIVASFEKIFTRTSLHKNDNGPIIVDAFLSLMAHIKFASPESQQETRNKVHQVLDQERLHKVVGQISDEILDKLAASDPMNLVDVFVPKSRLKWRC